MSSSGEPILASPAPWRLLAKFVEANQPSVAERLPRLLAPFRLPSTQMDHIQEAIAKALWQLPRAGQAGCLRVWVTAGVSAEALRLQPQNRWGFFITTRLDPASASADRPTVDFFLYLETGPGKASFPSDEDISAPGARDPPPD